MGQYYLTVNLDKRQYLHPHRFGEGLKLLEFGSSSDGTLTGLAILLADGIGRGSGDLHSGHAIIGSWAGDRIVLAGDYGDGLKYLNGVHRDKLQRVAEKCFTERYQQAERVNLYHWAANTFEDISDTVLMALADDPYIKQSLQEGLKSFRSADYLPLPDDLMNKVYGV